MMALMLQSRITINLRKRLPNPGTRERRLHESWCVWNAGPGQATGRLGAVVGDRIVAAGAIRAPLASRGPGLRRFLAHGSRGGEVPFRNRDACRGRRGSR